MEYRDDSAASAAHVHESGGCESTTRPTAPTSNYRRDIAPDYPEARIIRATDGGALRTFSGGLAHENGWFASKKARRLLHWQGIAQLEFITRAETDFGVGRMATESVRFEFVGATGKQVYTADVELVGSDGTITLVEIKRNERDLSVPGYREKLAAVRQICHAAGMAFKIAFRRDIWSSIVHRRNATLFASRAFTTVESEHLRRLEEYAGHAGLSASYGNLAAALEPHDPRTGEAVLQALTVARRVKIDLTKPLLDATPVSIH